MNFERESMRAVKLRLGGFQEREICTCVPCHLAGVKEGCVWVPDGTGPDELGVEVPYARQLHGRELVQHLDARGAFAAAVLAWSPAPDPRDDGDDRESEDETLDRASQEAMHP